MTILITGASKGVGAELALQLAEEGQQLLLVARNEYLLKDIADRCNKIGGPGTASAIAYDLAGILEAPSVFEQLLAEHTKTIDVLVNNAGMLVNQPFHALTTHEERSVFSINYFVPAQLIRICLPYLE